MKKRLTLHTIFTTLLILTCMTGCNNLAIKEVTATQTGGLHTIHGTCGESPSGSSARTVFPSATAGNVDHYVITATRTSDSKTVTARTAQGESDFSLALPNGTWQFQASGYNAAGEAGETEDNLVLKSDAADPNSRITLSDNTRAESASITLVVKPIQTDSGSGSIKVNIAFPASGTRIDLIEVQLGQTIEQLQAEDFAISGSDKIAALTLPDIKSGPHTLFITFKDSSGSRLYRISETVNVFDHLCSDNWVDTGRTGHYKSFSDGNYLYVTQSMIDSFELSNYYVDPVNGNDSNSGSWIKPFQTFEKALSTVNGTTQYTINLMGDVTVTTPASLEIDENLNLIIQGDGLKSSGEPYSLNFGGNEGFVITSPGNLTFRNICLEGAETDAGVIDDQSGESALQYTLEGYVIIKDNYADDGTTIRNLIVPFDTATKPLRISNTLDSRSQIGVTLTGIQPAAGTPVTIATNFSADNNAIPYDVFFSDNNDGIPVLNTDNSVSLARSSGTILAGEDITTTMPDYWIQRPDGGTKTVELSVRKDGNELTGPASYTYTLVKKGTSSSILERSAWTLENGNFTLEISVSDVPEGIYHFNVNVTVNGIRYSASKEILFSKGQALSDYAATHTTAPSSGQYVICTKEDMDLLRDMTNGTWTPAGETSAVAAASFNNSTITMFSDVDLGNEEWNIGIGTSGSAFRGTFNGNGHTIKGLNITGTTSGLFGYTDAGATVKNLTAAGTSKGSGIVYQASGTTIENVTSNIDITTEYISYYKGGFASIVKQNSVIKNCTNNGSITLDCSTSNIYFGALAGDCWNSTIENCSNYGTITIQNTGSNNYIGGISGLMETNGSTIKNCVNYGTINGENNNTNIAGIIGKMFNASQITGCSNHGNLICNNAGTAGGIVNSIDSYVSGKILTDCKNYGNITVSGNAGGIAAELSSENFGISECENYGYINSINSNAAGIIASLSYTGSNVTNNNLRNLINSGDIEAKGNASGIVNLNSSSASFNVYNCMNSGAVLADGIHAAGICTNAQNNTFLKNCVNIGQIKGSGTYTGGIATVDGNFNNCFYQYGKVLYGTTYGTGRGSGSALQDKAGEVEPCGPLFTTTGSRLGISPARNGVSDIAKLLNNNISSSSWKLWGYNTNGELTFTTYTDYTPFVIPPVITSASASSLSGYTSSDTVKIQIPAATTANNINSLLSGNTNNVKIILDLSNISGSFKDISNSLPNVTELVLPSVTFNDNQFGSDSIGFALDLKKVTIKGDVTGAWTFQKCTSIETVIFAEGVTSVSSGMFSKCTSLKTVVLPSTLTKIGYHAFANSAIEEIIIPANVREIQHYAFFDSTSSAPVVNLKRVIFEDTTRTWTIKQNGTGDVISSSPIGASAGGEPSVMPSDLTQIDVSDPVKNAEWFKSYLGRTEGYYWVQN